jgi:hypothetical protein
MTKGSNTASAAGAAYRDVRYLRRAVFDGDQSGSTTMGAVLERRGSLARSWALPRGLVSELGIALQIDASLTPGDWLDFHYGRDLSGKLLDIAWRTVVMPIPENIVIIPNGEFAAIMVTNRASQPCIGIQRDHRTGLRAQ